MLGFLAWSVTLKLSLLEGLLGQNYLIKNCISLLASVSKYGVSNTLGMSLRGRALDSMVSTLNFISFIGVISMIISSMLLTIS
ncbi:hypothetical protein DsansV1_C11g0112931 [Dioscorea sansibarensis]